MRYRCSDTQRGSTYDSHDSEIIEQFPLELHMGFPAVLSHKMFQRQQRISLGLSIQNFVGPERFQKILCELHVYRHNRIELQYLLSEYKKRNGIMQFFLQSQCK